MNEFSGNQKDNKSQEIDFPQQRTKKNDKTKKWLNILLSKSDKNVNHIKPV